MKLPIQFRDFQIRQEDIDIENRRVNLTFSSEFPVERFWGTEILDHSPDSVLLDRLKSAGPLLVMHDRAKQVGIIESAEVGTDKKGHANARFGKSDFAEEIFQDVQDGIRKTTSVAYILHEIVLEKQSDEKQDQYRVTKWEPIEISLEPTPADYSIGVGRSANQPEYEVKIINKRGLEMTEEEKKKLEDAKRKAEEEADQARNQAQTMAQSEIEAEKEKAKSEVKRVEEIMAIGARFNMLAEAQEAVKNKVSINEFQQKALDKLDNQKHIDTQISSIGMPPKDIQEYSILRAIQALLNKDWSKAGLELEASKEVAKRSGVDPRGFFIPPDVLLGKVIGKRDITTSGAAGLIATEHLAGSFIDLLRNRSRIIQLGAVTLAGLQGNVSIPKQTGAATAYWVDEGGETTESTPAFGALTLGPKTVTARVDYTRRMLLQSNPDIEMLVTNDLINVLALAIDLAAINGDGTGGKPIGILNTSGIGDVTGTTLAWAGVVEFETDVASANADIGSMAYLTNAAVNGILKTREKATNTARFLAENGEMNGYPVAVSNQVPAATMIFGVFGQILIGFWSGLDIKLDEVTLGDSGGIVVRAFQDCDIGIRQAAAFSASDEIS
jgi:HK97 family phage major capsid protein